MSAVRLGALEPFWFPKHVEPWVGDRSIVCIPGVLSEEVKVQLDSPPRSRGQPKVTVTNDRIGTTSFLNLRIRKVVEVLQYFSVSQSRHQVQSSTCTDNASNVVRSNQQGIRFSRRTNLLGFQKPTTLGHVRLENAHTPL